MLAPQAAQTPAITCAQCWTSSPKYSYSFWSLGKFFNLAVLECDSSKSSVAEVALVLMSELVELLSVTSWKSSIARCWSCIYQLYSHGSRFKQSTLTFHQIFDYRHPRLIATHVSLPMTGEDRLSPNGQHTHSSLRN